MLEQKDITHLASLARLELGEAESEGLRRDMESIIELMDSLHAVDMGGGEYQAPGVSADQLREDAALREIEPARFLEQSPAEGADGFTIPRMME
ncbi:MAG: Asp-tRNA(Asn)/Glu-tRNA(Gln) amidotransferase subunit GatC [Clostridiales bacterium]|nr:Asp-tRNA(Asn)/Glu-tRNA(Gln) amidotransferase subunit GatC [Clostridiales bacterium]